MNKKEIRRKRNFREAEIALQILDQKITSIRYVQDWALILGCSKTKLTRLITTHYKMSPKDLMKQVRLERIRKTIKENPEFGSYAVADECGLPNDKVLYQFLNRNFETSFSDLRFEILWNEDGNVQNG